MTFPTLQSILKACSALVMVLGLIVALAAHPATSAGAGFLLDLIFWPLDGSPTLESGSVRLLAAIAGGVMVGWGVMLWQVAAHILPSNAALAINLLRSGLIAWFAVDSLGSLAAGAPINVALNVALLAAFLWPLARVQSIVRAR